MSHTAMLCSRSPSRSVARAVALLLSVFLLAAGEARLSLGAQSTVQLTFREGTNMAAALSSDGRTLALDVQGRIWTLAATGGTAHALTDALGDARQPAWSPDGRRIAFQAYWDGNYHIWSVAADGTGLRQHTWGPFDDREPHWSPDGSRIAFASDRAGSYDIWVVEVGSGRLERRSSHAANESAPVWSPDGGEIAFASDRNPGAGIYVLGAGGQERFAAPARGAAAAPSWSPDGRRVAYNDIHDRVSELLVAEVGAGRDPVSIGDRLEDVFPFRVSWTSAGELIYTGDGKIRVRPAGGGRARDIAFQATVELARAAYQKKVRDFDGTGARPVKGINTPVLSPDGERVAFTALGDLWVMRAGQNPQRITNDVYIDIDPAWSADGQRLVFGSDRTGSMDLWVRELANGAERRLTELPGEETQPTWSPDGSEIAFRDGGMIRAVSVQSGAVRALLPQPLNNPGRASWSPDGRTLALSALKTYSGRYREGVNRILLISADGRTQRMLEDFVPHRSIGSRGSDGPLWSPDGRMFAFVMDGLLWVVDVSQDGEPVGTPRRLTNELADYPSWSGDSKSILYVATDRLRRVHLDDGRIADVPVQLTWQPANPTGRVVVHAGAVFDGRSPELRRNMDVVIEGHRIVSVQPHDDALHSNRVVDASDATIMPGLIEMHAHQAAAFGEALGRLWLSFGITSVREPAADAYESMERVESMRSGKRPGPRTFRTGSTFDGSRIFYSGGVGMEAAAQVELELERARRMDYDVIKTYVRLPDAIQKRVIDAAHAMGIPVTSHELYPAVSYGADGVEHLRGTSRRGYSPKVSQLGRSYQDVVDLLARTDMTITPTLRLGGGFNLNIVKDPSVVEDRRLATFFGTELVNELRAQAAQTRRGDMEGLQRAVRDQHAVIRRIVEGGGTVIAGTDSNINPYGLALITEVEGYVIEAGLTPFQALQTATVNAARALGVSDQLGAVAPGMLADIVILDGNPLQDIRNIRKVRAVIINGRLYQMEELLTRPSPTT